MPGARVSVVMPVLNESQRVRGALARLAGVTTECIVVDGGSTDNTSSEAEAAGAQVIRSERGRALQQNAGAEAASGDVLLFLHVDTVLPCCARERLESFADSSDEWGRFDVSLSGSARWFRMIEWFMNRRSRLTGIATGDQAIFVRRSVFEEIGGFAAIELMEDIELSARLRERSKPVCLGDRVITSSRRWEACGVPRTVLLMWRLRLQFFLGVSPARLAELYR